MTKISVMQKEQHRCWTPFTSSILPQRPSKRLRRSRVEASGPASDYLLHNEWTRRSILKFLAASPLSAAPVISETSQLAETSLADAQASDSSSSANSTDSSPRVDTTITDKVFLDVGLCQNGTQTTRGLGDKAYCTNPDSLGRVVIGLYGRQVPATVQNFLALVKQGAYNSTVFNKILPGEYVTAGKQGPSRMGEVALTQSLPANKDVLLSRSFELEHRRAGTVSLNLSNNNDDAFYQQNSNYRNVSFLITTGPGPATSLDGQNIVFGKVLEGMDTVAKIAGVPTFKPVNDRMLAFNKLGSILGDDRAEKTRKKWGRPLKPVLITNTGILT